MTVKDFAETVFGSETVTVLLNETSFKLIDEGKTDTTILEMLGNYVLECFFADAEQGYTLAIKMKPVKEEA